jgi:amino acid adenylation domain-containing protein
VATPLPHQLAYVLFTSGSTGVPKGAMIEQEGMLNHLLCKIQALELRAEDRVGQIASQSFDISIWQMLAILLVGGRVQVLSDEVSHDPRRLIEQIQGEQLSVVQLVPSLLGAVLDELERLGERRPAFAHLRWLVPTGEALPPEVCRRWLTLYPHIPLVNAYGPTETSDDVTHALITHPPAEEWVRMPIGTALENTQLYVLGRYGERLPRGAHGELYIGGKGVGRGYLGDARKTAASFIPDGWSGAVGGRLYRTGDMVRYRSDGQLEYQGRIDEQVKLRGYRIELGEIEEVIREQEGVKEVVVVLRDVEGEEKRLVAYVTGRELCEQRLREAVGKHLPEYMVPWTWVVLEELPLMINGKVDRQGLPAPQRRQQEEREAFRGPRTDLEEVLAGIWGELLGIERVGIDENFFALGGHSLLATRFLAHMQEFFQVEIPLLLFFKHPTIAELAAFLLQEYQLEEEKVG